MRLLVTGGGTGGHVYPALAVLEVLLGDPSWAVRREDVAWVGSADSIEERILAREGLAFYAVETGAIRGMSLLTILRSLGRMGRGYRQARALIRTFRPNAVLATGGYVCVPLVLAAYAERCPAMIYLPDMEPGLAVRLLARLVRRVAVSFESVAVHLPKDKAFVSGYPVRRALYRTERAIARERLNLNAGLPVLLILGGSRGAHSINEAVRTSLDDLLTLAQVVHVCGDKDFDRLNALREGLSSERRERYHLFAYMYEGMTDAMVAADLVVARAGAATLGEFPAAGLPAVLVPYPYSGQHQLSNAAYLAERGAAVIVLDQELGGRLYPVVKELLGDAERLRTMRDAARALAVPDAAERIARELLILAQEQAG